MLGGLSLLVAAACVARVREVVLTDVPEIDVLRADAAEVLLTGQTAQPVPSRGMIDGRS